MKIHLANNEKSILIIKLMEAALYLESCILIERLQCEKCIISKLSVECQDLSFTFIFVRSIDLFWTKQIFQCSVKLNRKDIHKALVLVLVPLQGKQIKKLQVLR